MEKPRPTQKVWAVAGIAAERRRMICLQMPAGWEDGESVLLVAVVVVMDAAAAVTVVTGAGVGDALALVVARHGGLPRLLGQDGAVDLHRGQTVQRLHHGLVGEIGRASCRERV